MNGRWNQNLVNVFINNVNKKLSSKAEVFLIPNYLTDLNESPIYIIEGSLENIHTKKYIGNGIMLLTNKRVIFLRKGFFNSVTSEIAYLSNITSCSYKHSFLRSGEIDLRMSNNSASISFIDKNDADKMHRLINQALQTESYKDKGETIITNSQTPHISNVDQIERYHDLLTKGIITQEEFEAKKKQLLNL